MTDEVVQPDPHLKVNLRAALMEAVYGPPEQKIQNQLDDLLNKNRSWCISYRGRAWKGALYLHTPFPPLIPRPDKTLLPEMAAWYAQVLKLEEEKALTGGAITAVLNAVHHQDDFFKLFPECLQGALQDFLDALPFPLSGKQLTDEQLAALKTRQGPYIALLGQRMVRTLISY